MDSNKLKLIVDFLKKHKVASAICVIVLAISVIVANVACTGLIGADGHEMHWSIGGTGAVTSEVKGNA